MASLHASGGGVLGLLAAGLLIFLAVPMLVLVSARAGERARDFRRFFIFWILLNVTACVAPTGQYGGAADQAILARFKYLSIACFAVLCGVRAYQYIRKRRSTSQEPVVEEGDA